MIQLNKFHKESQERLKSIGIYKITALHNGKVYVGSTASLGVYTNWSGFKLRWLHHISSLIKNKHNNIILQRIVNKYGIDDLFFEIIEICDKNDTLEREQYWIDYYDSYNNGLNLRPNAASNLGRKWSQETKDKQSISISKVLKEKYSKEAHHMLGYVMPDSHKEKLSLSKRMFSEDDILNIHNDLKLGNSFVFIRKKYNVSQDTIRRIINGKFNNLDWSFIIKRSQKFNKSKIETMLKYREQGLTMQQIADKMNVSQGSINYWLQKLVKSRL